MYALRRRPVPSLGSIAARPGPRARFSIQALLDATDSGIQAVHAVSGAPWWLTIPLSTLAIRGVFLAPLRVVRNRGAGRLADLAALRSAQQFRDEYVGKIAKSGRLDPAIARAIVSENAAKLRSLKWRSIAVFAPFVGLPVMQSAIFILVSLTIRGMTGLPLPSFVGTLDALPALATGGFGIFSDLTAAEPTGFMPALLMACNLINAELNTRDVAQTATPRQRHVSNAIRSLVIAGGAFISYLSIHAPLGLSLYWLSSALVSMGEKALGLATVQSSRVDHISKSAWTFRSPPQK